MKFYELLVARGYLESGGKLYFPEDAVLDCLEYLHEHFGSIAIDDFEKRLNEVLDRTMKKLAEGYSAEPEFPDDEF